MAKAKISFLRRPQVEKRTGVPRSTIYLWIKEGIFPKPVKLGKRSVGWIEAEIDDWQAAHIEDRDS